MAKMLVCHMRGHPIKTFSFLFFLITEFSENYFRKTEIDPSEQIPHVEICKGVMWRDIEGVREPQTNKWIVRLKQPQAPPLWVGSETL